MEEQPINGVEHQLTNEELELELRDAQRIAARLPSVTLIEKPEHDVAPFEQQTHTFLIESIDQEVQAWIDELKHVRNNNAQLEQLVLAKLDRTKRDLTELHLLGAQVLMEARRGDDVCASIARKVDQLMDGREAP